ASATVTSPAKTDNTILVFSSAGTAGGLAMNDQTPHRSGPQATGPATKSDARQRNQANAPCGPGPSLAHSMLTASDGGQTVASRGRAMQHRSQSDPRPQETKEVGQPSYAARSGPRSSLD